MNKKIIKKRKCRDFILQYLYIPIIAPIIVAVILSFLKIHELDNKIEIQNSVIQNNKIEIQKLENNIQEQNILINNYEQQIIKIENEIKTYIETNRGPIHVY